jgi:hypothetical protein
MKQYSSKMNDARKLSFYYNLAILYFLTEKYGTAQGWVEKILDEKSKHRKDIQHFAKVLNTLLWYELEGDSKRIDIHESAFRSAYRKLQNEQRLFEFEKVLLNHLRKLSGELDTASVFKSLQEQLLVISQNPKEKHALGLEEVMLWVGGKIG